MTMVTTAMLALWPVERMVARMDDAELGARLRELAAKLGLVTTTVGSSLVGDAGAAAGEERS